MAILRILAERDDLINFISTDEKLARFLEAVWEKQYGIEEVKGFRKDPSQPKYIQMFLRYILETRLQLSTNDAARLGLQIANIFVSLGKKSYNKMAYFDIKSKSFNWF